MSTTADIENITITHEQTLEAAKHLALGKIGRQWNNLRREAQHEYIGLAKIAFTTVGLNVAPNADGTCGQVNSDYPEHQCTYPAGHGTVQLEDEHEEILGEHGDEVTVWSGF